MYKHFPASRAELRLQCGKLLRDFTLVPDDKVAVQPVLEIVSNGEIIDFAVRLATMPGRHSGDTSSQSQENCRATV